MPDFEKVQAYLKDAVKPGTSKARVFYAIAFCLLALLILWLGWKRALFVAVLTALGAVLGGITDYKKAVSDTVNKVVPPKNQKVTYTAEDLKKVKEVLEQKPVDKTPAEPADTATAKASDEADKA